MVNDPAPESSEKTETETTGQVIEDQDQGDGDPTKPPAGNDVLTSREGSPRHNPDLNP